METKVELRKTKDMVEEILAKEERARNDDNWLWYRVLEECCKSMNRKMFIPFEIWSTFPKVSTVFRVRQYIQNTQGKYRPTDPDVIRKRKLRQTEFREAFRKIDTFH